MSSFWGLMAKAKLHLYSYYQFFFFLFMMRDIEKGVAANYGESGGHDQSF